MNGTELFNYHLSLYSKTTGVAVSVDDNKQTTRRLKLIRQVGYIPSSRGGAFFIIACIRLAEHPCLEIADTRIVTAYAKAIAEVFIDNKHGRCTDIATSLASAIHEKPLTNAGMSAIAIPIGVELIEKDASHSGKRVLTDELANRILERRDLF